MIKETIVPRTVTSPKKFFIGAEMLSKIDDFVKDFGDMALIVSDEFILKQVEEEALPALRASNIGSIVETFRCECCQQEIDRLQAVADTQQANVVVGIGGGKTLDTAKAVAFYQKIPVVLFPTIASSDAPCTALAVIYTESGEFEKYLFLPQNPDVVVADTSIISKAPAKFFSAGVGDALATYFEARACYKADGINLVRHKPSQTGLGLAKLCYDLLSKNIDMAMDAIENKSTTLALEQTIEATIYLSGVGAEAGGLAAAHAVNNGMSVIPDLHKAQHGEKVVFGLLTQLVLENAPQDEIDDVVRIIKRAKLPLTLKEMGLKTFVEAEWREVARIACAPDDTMNNMPMDLTINDVYYAIVAANALGERYSTQ